MIGILLVTHGEFGKELQKSAELIIGNISNCVALSLNREDDISDLKKKVDCQVEKLNEGEGVITLVDMIGGSPFNVCSVSLREGRNFRLLSGLNLSMLIECAMMRNSQNLEELAEHCRQSGINSVIEVKY